MINKYYQQWKAYKDIKNNITYNLQHLHIFSIKKKINNNIIKIVIRFSDHCFTKNLEEWKKYNKKELYLFSPINRIFCKNRYRLSLKLKKILKEKFNWNIFFKQKTQTLDFFKVEIWDEKFYIYFDLKKTKSDSLLMSINSIYTRKNNPEKNSQKINFDLLIEKILKNKDPRL